VVTDPKEMKLEIQVRDSHSNQVLESGVLACSEQDLLEGERNRREDIDTSRMQYSGELKKMGR
jgi:hypothetical protein